MEDLYQIRDWKRITKNREKIIFDLFEKYISEEEAEYYKNCNCPSSIRIMYLDLRKFLNDLESKQN